MIEALEWLGLKYVDFLTGSSSGIANLAYVASGQLNIGRQVWPVEIPNLKFIGIKNLFAGKPFLDLDQLIEKIFKGRFGLDVEALKRSPMKLVIPVTSAETGKPRYIDSQRDLDKVDIFEVLKAAMAVPFLYGRTVRLDDGEYFDGAVSDPFPIDYGEIANSRKIIAMTQPEDYHTPYLEQKIAKVLKRRLPPGVYEGLQARPDVVRKRQREIKERERNGEAHVIRPSFKLSSLKATRRNIEAITRAGINDTLGHEGLLSFLKELSTTDYGVKYFHNPPLKCTSDELMV